MEFYAGLPEAIQLMIDLVHPSNVILSRYQVLLSTGKNRLLLETIHVAAEQTMSVLNFKLKLKIIVSGARIRREAYNNFHHLGPKVIVVVRIF